MLVRNYAQFNQAQFSQAQTLGRPAFFQQPLPRPTAQPSPNGLQELFGQLQSLTQGLAAPQTEAPGDSAFTQGTPQLNANEQKSPVGFPSLPYGSNPAAALVPTPAERPEFKGGIGTPPEVGQMANAGVGNMLNPAWQEAVANAAAANGGLGNAQDGYLAFSAEFGFVRLNNPNLTPEQNRRLAEISLSTGWPIEKTPANAEEAGAKAQESAEKFITKYDSEFADFAKDPSNGISVKEGKTRFRFDVDPQTGLGITRIQKRHGGLRGLIESNAGGLSKVLGLAGSFASLIPGWGTLVSAGLGVAQGAVEQERAKKNAPGIS
ncbi:MAG: hypothetical protein ACOYN0_16565 [Phycisphaerales bacterium]